jgi:outer membrane protein assembly factor BamB
VLLAGDKTLEARAIENGQILWTRTLSITGPLAPGDGRLFAAGHGVLHALALEDGQPLWTAALDGATTGPRVAAGHVFVSSGAELRAHRADDGALVWRRSLDAAATLPPVVAGRLLVLGLGGNRLVAVDRQDGVIVWQVTLDAAPGPLAVGDERLLFSTATGRPCAARLEDGHLIGCVRTSPVPAVGAPVIADGSAYFARLDNTLRAFDVDGGTLTRLELLPARPALAPVQAGRYLVVPLTTGAFALLSPGTPQPVSFLPAARGVPEDAVAAPGEGWLVALSIDAGAPRVLTGYRQTPAAPAP